MLLKYCNALLLLRCWTSMPLVPRRGLHSKNSSNLVQWVRPVTPVKKFCNHVRRAPRIPYMRIVFLRDTTSEVLLRSICTTAICCCDRRHRVQSFTHSSMFVHVDWSYIKPWWDLFRNDVIFLFWLFNFNNQNKIFSELCAEYDELRAFGNHGQCACSHIFLQRFESPYEDHQRND